MSQDTQTPDQVAAEVHAAIREALEDGKRRALASAINTLCESDQPLAAFHVVRRSGMDEGKALAVLDRFGAGGEVLDLLAVERLFEGLEGAQDE